MRDYRFKQPSKCAHPHKQPVPRTNNTQNQKFQLNTLQVQSLLYKQNHEQYLF